jgi:integrase
MPRLSNRPPQMQRYAGVKARVSIDGKYHYLGKWGSDKAKAKYNHLIKKWRENQKADSVSVNDRYLIAELAADYIEHVKTYYGDGHNRATSLAPMIRCFGLHFGDMWTDEFRPRHLVEARKIWLDRNCSRIYVNRVTREIVRCFKWGVTKEHVPVSVWKALEAVESIDIGRYNVREAPPVEAVPYETVDELLPHLSETVRDMVSVQLLSGCRPHEIMRLTPGEIDRSEDVWKYRPSRHKNAWRGKRRTIYFGPQAQTILAKYLFRDDNAPCFVTKFGKPFARAGYRQAIQRVSEKHGLPRWAPNQLRHLKATEIREMKNLEIARAVLGHGSQTTTLIYAELNEEPAKEFARKMG